MGIPMSRSGNTPGWGARQVCPLGGILWSKPAASLVPQWVHAGFRRGSVIGIYLRGYIMHPVSIDVVEGPPIRDWAIKVTDNTLSTRLPKTMDIIAFERRGIGHRSRLPTYRHSVTTSP